MLVVAQQWPAIGPSMANFEKRQKGWRVRVRKNGQGHSATFPNKVQAQEWAAQIEADIIAGKLGKSPDKTFSDLIDRYINEVTITKRGARPEKLRLERLKRDKIAQIKLADLTPDVFADWRDRRMKEVGNASVIREFTTMSHACTVAVKEWRWLRENPLSYVRRPPDNPPRQRLITQDEINRILLVCGKDYSTKMGRVGAAFEFAIETAMRAGEICDLKWENVFANHVHVRQFNDVGKLATKTGTSRDVPLSKKAVEILGHLKCVPDNNMFCFGLTPSVLDTLFRRARDRALVTGITFHDSRGLALTRLSKKLDLLALARISGHRDLSLLQRVYYRMPVADLAAMLE
jgi:integrase